LKIGVSHEIPVEFCPFVDPLSSCERSIAGHPMWIQILSFPGFGRPFESTIASKWITMLITKPTRNSYQILIVASHFL